MNERAARDVLLLRAIETTDGAREIWSDADRLWAGRSAAEVVGESAAGDAFLGQRAALALQRLATRHPKLASLARAPSSRGWLALLAAGGAFVAGVAGVDIGPGHRINLLAPPVLALLAWNLGVYVMLVAGAFARKRARVAERGPVRRNLIAWLGDVSRPARSATLPAPLAAAVARFAADWSALATPLWGHRVARLLHVCAATLAAGAIAGLYLRGIALEFRAGWQSTFLEAAEVAGILKVVLAPGSWLTGIAIPGAGHLQTIAGYGGGENAARWIHLYAATIVCVVIAPRLMLAAVAWLRETRLANRLPVALAEPYFQRLLHAWREGAARIVALPYSYGVPQANAAGLAQVLTRVFESAVEIRWTAVVAYGADDVPEMPAAAPDALVAVFNLTATPEAENHGAFLSALTTSVGARVPVIAIVDTSEFVGRFHDQPRRVSDRQDAWRHALAARDVDPMFVRLAKPDLADAAAALAQRMDITQPQTATP